MANAELNLLHYGFYEDDDADPDACTQVGSEDTPLTRGTGTGNRVMVRTLLDEVANKDDSGQLFLQYELNNDDSWNDVTASSNVAQITAGTPVDDAVCNANNLTPPSGKSFPGDWFDGRYDEDDGSVSSVPTKNNYGEYQVCLYIVDVDVNDGDTVKFRWRAVNIDVTTPPTREAEITVSKPAGHVMPNTTVLLQSVKTGAFW